MENTQVKIKNTGKKQIFDNPFLEALTRTHISIPLVLFNGIAIGLIYYGISEGLISPLLAVSGFLVGLLLFTWVEYNAHRYVFHMDTSTKLRENIQYKFHGVHHEYPKDKARLAMPPVVSVVLATILFFIFRLIMGNFVFGFLPGFLVGYASYLGVHYIVHAYRPPSNFFKALWVNHGIHHYKENDRAFGVSSPLWDYIYRTMPRAKAS